MPTYMIGNAPGTSDPLSISDLAGQLDKDPDTSVIKLIESPVAPLLLIDMPDDAAEKLKKTYEGRLSIELVAPLSPYTSEATNRG